MSARRVLVTGASRGIGAACARRFRPLRLHPHAARYMENYMKEHHLWSSRAREVLKRHTA